MKVAIIVCITALLIAVTICGSVSLNNYVNRDRPHVDSGEDTFIKDCSKRGGNVVIKSGYVGELRTSSQNCEGVE